MKEITIEAYGKLNLALNILGKRGNIHTIESPAVHVDIKDTVTVKRSVCSSVECSVNVGRGGVEKTLELLDDAGLGNFSVRIIKRIPIAGGMGGSSADVAALLHAVRLMSDVDDGTIREIAAKAGSDVPFMLFHGAGVIGGGGEKVDSLTLPRMFFVAARYGRGVVSADCYKKFDELGCRGNVCDIPRLLSALENGDVRLADSLSANALQPAVCALSRDITAPMNAFDERGVGSHITGSGNSVFCFVETLEESKRLAASIDPRFSPISLVSSDTPLMPI